MILIKFKDQIVIYTSGVFEDKGEIDKLESFIRELIEYSKEYDNLYDPFEFIFRNQDEETIESIIDMIEESSTMHLLKRTKELIENYSDYKFSQNVLY